MPTQPTIFELKAQAHRLAQGLAQLNLSVTHAQTLDLIGRVQGKRDWRELVGTLSERNPKLVRRVEPVTPRNFLVLLEWVLRCQGFKAEDLDDLVHDSAAPARVSRINNEGLSGQLAFLLEDFGSELELLQTLERSLQNFSFEKVGVLARVRVATSSAVVQFDALPWFLQASSEQVQELLQVLSQDRGFIDGPLAQSIVAWSAQNGRDTSLGRDDTERLQAMARGADLETSPVVLALNKERVRRFLQLYHAHSPEALRPLMEGEADPFEANPDAQES